MPSTPHREISYICFLLRCLLCYSGPPHLYCALSRFLTSLPVCISRQTETFGSRTFKLSPISLVTSEILPLLFLIKMLLIYLVASCQLAEVLPFFKNLLNTSFCLSLCLSPSTETTTCNSFSWLSGDYFYMFVFLFFDFFSIKQNPWRINIFFFLLWFLFLSPHHTYYAPYPLTTTIFLV